MANKILLDADFLIAVTKLDDENHDKAMRKAILHQKNHLYITTYSIPEAVTVLSYRVSQNVAKKFLSKIRELNLIEILPNKNLIEKTDVVFLSQKNKRISWFDCFNVACTYHFELDGILSFDKFYKKNNIRVY